MHGLMGVVVAVSGCAGQRHPHAPSYTCGDTVVAPLADDGGAPALAVGDIRAPRAGHDRDGDHFVVADGGRRVEYVVPDDPREDTLVWALGAGGERQMHGLCTARGGHTDLLARWVAGQSLAEIGNDLGLEPEQVRTRIQRAIQWMRRRTVDAEALVPAPAPGPIATT